MFNPLLMIPIISRFSFPTSSTYSDVDAEGYCCVVIRTHTHTHKGTQTHSVGLPWTRHQPVAEARPFTTKKQTRENFHAPGGIRTRKSNSLGTAKLRLRPPDHRDRQLVDILWPTNYEPLICCSLTLNMLTTTIVAPPSNASKWQMGFNSAFKGLIVRKLSKQ